MGGGEKADGHFRIMLTCQEQIPGLDIKMQQRVLLPPPCRSYPGTFATFPPAHSGVNGASWPGLLALPSTLWKSSRNSRQKHI